MSFPTGPHEEERLRSLLETGILQGGPSPTLDAICLEASRHFDVPMCLVTLLDKDKQWIKGKEGTCITETGRDVAFCNFTILSDDVFVINDALDDERFKNNPVVVGEPHVRFYAGAPLIYLRSIRLGALCLLDTKPRPFSRGDKAELALFADRVVAEIAAREFGSLPTRP